MKACENGIQKDKRVNLESCNFISPYLFRTDCHSDRCHRNVRTSPLLGCRNMYLQPQPPASLLPVGLGAVPDRRHCHLLHLFLLVQQLVPHKHSFLSPILHLLLCAVLSAAVYQCKWSCVKPFPFPCHASFSSVRYH